MRTLLASASLMALACLPVATRAQEATAPATASAADATDDTFQLGQIVVTGNRDPALSIGADTLGQEAIYQFGRASLDDAVNLLPGVNAGNSGGSRNERLIFVRGFNRFQVPLTIDGIRVYLPADNRLDYGRFLTPDVAEVQVAKGYVSVLNGPDGMGGAVNLVTRKPTAPFEAEARGTLDLGRAGEYAGYTAFGLLGTRHDRWYAQASYTRDKRDHWDLSGGFTPTAIENGYHRDLSATEDSRLNVKVGVTPNATDEYSLSYTRQEGSKLAPLDVRDPLSTQRFWTWPEWNIDSVYFLSTTALGDRATLKTRVYRNTFYNLLRAFNDRNENTQTLARAFNSPYNDEAYGASGELAVRLWPADLFSLALQYRRDKHVEAQQSYPSGTYEPDQEDLEDTWSIAAENRLVLSPTLTVVAGAGYDWRNLLRAEEYGAPLGTNPSTTASQLFSYPIRNTDAWSAQGELLWQPDPATALHASVSSRARFPTIFERFSQRFGTSIPNPDLRPERANNFEVGGSRAFGILHAEAAVFYSHVEDAIVSYPTIAYSCTGSTTPPPTPVAGCTAASLVQSRNLGHGDYYGTELSLEARLGPSFSIGGNYTYTHRKLIDPSSAAFRPTDVPTDKAFVYADWQPFARLHVLPSVDIASNRWTVTDVAPIRYYRTGSYANAALRIDYAIRAGVDVSAGARNLFDENYELVDGFPEQGRSYFVSLRARYR